MNNEMIEEFCPEIFLLRPGMPSVCYKKFNLNHVLLLCGYVT